MSNVRVEGITVIPSTLPPMVGNMTLRDWYAGMAMQGDWVALNAGWDCDEAAARYYKMADAMMAAREK